MTFRQLLIKHVSLSFKVSIFSIGNASCSSQNALIFSRFEIDQEKNFVRSGIRTHASNGDQKPLFADAAQVITLESGALDRSAILTAGNAESTKSFNSALLIPVEQDKFHYRDQLKN